MYNINHKNNVTIITKCGALAEYQICFKKTKKYVDEVGMTIGGNIYTMGRKSTKENKNIYQTSRENLELTREAAAEKLQFISADRIEKIESEKTLPHPEEILAMADCYKNPSICNYFCSNICPIGREYVPEVKSKDLAQVTLEMVVTLNNLVKERDRLLEITVDGKISDDELSDFINIKDELEKMSLTIDSLKLWVNNSIAAGELDKSSFEK